MSELKHIVIPLLYNSSLIFKSNDTKIYRDAVLLTPGLWADMISNSNILYKSEKLTEYATNWSNNIIDLHHSHHPLHLCGTVRNQRWGYSDKLGKYAVLGDLYIERCLSAGKEVATLIDLGLVNQLSVERYHPSSRCYNLH